LLKRNLRLIDIGDVRPIQTLALSHAVGQGVATEQTDTILVMRPTSPSVSVGKYQETRKDVDEGFCNEHDIPVLRRQIGGGAQYVDPGYLVFQSVVGKARSLKSITRLNQDLLRALVETYSALGVDAHYHPVSDIYVRESPISRCTVGTIRGAILQSVGINISGDNEMAARVLKIDDEPASMAQELDVAPDISEVAKVFEEQVARILRVNLVPEELSAQEHEAAKQLEKELSEEEWTHHVDNEVAKILQLDGDEIQVYRGYHTKLDMGVIRAYVAIKDQRIHDVVFSGDIFFSLDHLQGLQRSFLDAEPDWDDLMTVAERYYLSFQVDSPGTTPTDWVSAIMAATDI